MERGTLRYDNEIVTGKQIGKSTFEQNENRGSSGPEYNGIANVVRKNVRIRDRLWNGSLLESFQNY